VTFSENSTNNTGGGIDNASKSNPILTNVTFSGNRAFVGGGIYSQDDSTPLITNSILWANEPEQQIAGSATVSYSIIQFDHEGDNNLADDPLLDVLAINGGFTPTYALLTGSPAINAGHPFSCPPIDQRGYPRPADGSLTGEPRCDIGAFEFQPGLVYLPVVRK
jgi:predicted outer membrane repeat protein